MVGGGVRIAILASLRSDSVPEGPNVKVAGCDGMVRSDWLLIICLRGLCEKLILDRDGSVPTSEAEENMGFAVLWILVAWASVKERAMASTASAASGAFFTIWRCAKRDVVTPLFVSIVGLFAILSGLVGEKAARDSSLLSLCSEAVRGGDGEES